MRKFLLLLYLVFLMVFCAGCTNPFAPCVNAASFAIKGAAFCLIAPILFGALFGILGAFKKAKLKHDIKSKDDYESIKNRMSNNNISRKLKAMQNRLAREQRPSMNDSVESFKERSRMKKFK